MAQFKEIVKARYLRQTETKTEKILWSELRKSKLNTNFRRQHPIDVFVLDFYAPKIKLAIELDGAPHKTKDGREYDKMRTEFLKSRGVIMIRFWNSEIEKDLKSVLNKIKEKILELSRN